MQAAPPHPKNLIYVCGPHGVGKTTLITAVCAARPSTQRAPRIQLALPSEVSAIRRVAVRFFKYAAEYELHQKLAALNPGTLFIGDRCAYDSLAYLLAYRHLGWATRSDANDLLRIAISTSSRWGLPQSILHLSPPLADHVRNLRNRQRQTDDDWAHMQPHLLLHLRSSYCLLFRWLTKHHYLQQYYCTGHFDPADALAEFEKFET